MAIYLRFASPRNPSSCVIVRYAAGPMRGQFATVSYIACRMAGLSVTLERPTVRIRQWIKRGGWREVDGAGTNMVASPVWADRRLLGDGGLTRPGKRGLVRRLRPGSSSG
jgi:hypothetical protein